MNAYIKSDECEYMVENIVGINYTDDTLTIIYKWQGEISVIQLTKDNLDGATVNIF